MCAAGGKGGPRSLALTLSSRRLISFVGSLVPDAIVCLNSRGRSERE